MAMNLPSRHAGRRRAPMAEINVTPLVDVMLVLLIIFMVTAPMLSAGVPVNLPDSSAKPLPTDTKPITVSIDAHGKVFVGNDAVSDGGLPQALEKAGPKDGSKPDIVLKADRSLDYGRVAKVMGDLGAAGMSKVSLETGVEQRR